MPVQIIGEPSQSTREFAGRRSNRMMQAISEAGELERQTNQLNTQRAIASQQETGATNRTAMQEQGANQRQQVEVQAQDKQQAGAIKAQLERDRLLDANETRRLTLQRTWKEIDDKAKQALARGDRDEYLKYYKEAQQIQASGQIAEMAIMAQSMGGVIKAVQLMNGQETSKAKIEAANETMKKQVASAARVRDDMKGMAQASIAEEAPQWNLAGKSAKEMASPEAVGALDRVVQNVSTKLQSPFTMDLFTDPVKLETWAQKATPVDYAVAKTVLTEVRTKLESESKAASKKGDTETVVYGQAFDAAPDFGGKTIKPSYETKVLAAAPSEYISANLKRIQAAEDALNRLQFSDTQTADGRRLGDYVTAMEMAYKGNTAGAFVVGAFDQAGGDPNAMMRVLMPSPGAAGVDWSNPIFSGLTTDPDVRARVDQMLMPYYQALYSGYGPAAGAGAAQQAVTQPQNQGMGSYGDFMRR